jgi:N-acetylneuraminic acid mutarotase
MAAAMKLVRTLVLAAVLAAVILVPLAALVELPGESRLKSAVGFDTCGPIENRGDAADWRVEPPTPTLRDGPASAQVDGLIYLLAGIETFTDDFQRARSLATFEVFDPATRRWSTLPPLPKALNHVAMAAVGGEIYSFGGNTDRLREYASTGESWRFLVKERRWEPVAPLPTPRGGAGTAVVGDRIFVAGGRAGDRSLDVVESYDTKTGRWSTHAPMPTRRDHLEVAVDGGRLYALGGRKEDVVSLATHERYDPAADAWSAVPGAPERKAGFAYVETPAGLVAAGGESLDEWRLFGGVFAFDPDSGRWRTLPSMAEPKHGFAGEYVDGRLYAIGGSRCSGFRPVRSSASMAIG